MRVWPLTKTGILIILVAASLLLSKQLWTGDWGGAGEVTYSPEPTLPPASVPSESAVTTPAKIIITDQGLSQSAVFIPQTADYTSWLKRLGNAHVYSVHMVSSIPTAAFVHSVEFDFGVEMNYQALIHYIPGLQPSVLQKQAQYVYLYQTSATGQVMLGLDSEQGTYIAETDILPRQFAALTYQAAILHPWEAWNPATNSFVPKNGFEMSDVTVSLTPRSIVPLIHSFFANPQAVTSVSESPSTLLSTDGSRAVWWNQQQHTLIYADPNPNAGTTPTDAKGFVIQDILDYARVHGGAPESSILVHSNPTSLTPGTNDWVLRPYLFGYPIVDSNEAIHVENVGAEIIRYQMPLDTYSINQQNPVQILGAADLTQIVAKLMPSTSTSDLSIDLGYYFHSIDDHNAEFIPAYQIAESGMVLYEINAATGAVLKGMNGS